MTMSASLRKFALTVHLISSVSWIGAAASFVALTVVVLTSQDARMVRAVYFAADPVTWFAIIPLALASLLTGLVMSLGTPWGLFRHYWVLITLVLTILSTIVLLQFAQTVSDSAGVAAETGGAARGELPSYLLHSGVGVLVLLVITVLNVYKPRGVTPYGWRKQQEERARLERRASAVGRPKGSSPTLPAGGPDAAGDQ